MKKPRILCFDIETAPIEAYTWGTFNVNIPIEMIKRDFAIISFAGKFLDEKEIHYLSTENKRDPYNDKELIMFIQDILSQADVLVSQNGARFDIPKINSRAWAHDLEPNSFKDKKHVDLYSEGKKIFGHTSHKLAWITQKLSPSHQKSDHAKFPGFSLWKEALSGNRAAWNEMEKYNKQDVLSTIEVYKDYMRWFNHIDLRPTYKPVHKHDVSCRACGSYQTIKHATRRTTQGLFQRFFCKACGCITQMKGAANNLDKKEK